MEYHAGFEQNELHTFEGFSGSIDKYQKTILKLNIIDSY